MNKLAIVAFLFGIFISSMFWEYHTQKESFTLDNISDEERWNDLNNEITRDRFCQAMNYQDSKIYSEWDRAVIYYAGSPYGYEIYCLRFIEEHKIYNYFQYKKWIVSMELENKNMKSE